MLYTENTIPEEALPPRSGLLILRFSDPNHGLDTVEIQDRLEFIRCYLLKEFELLLMVPKSIRTNDFFANEITSVDPQYSAFNTMDFKNRPFNKYGYAIAKIMERIQDLAVMHSSISNPDNRAAVKKRYENYLDIKFRDQLAVLIVQLQNTADSEKRYKISHKIVRLNRLIIQARKVWERYAPPENWDR